MPHVKPSSLFMHIACPVLNHFLGKRFKKNADRKTFWMLFNVNVIFDGLPSAVCAAHIAVIKRLGRRVIVPYWVRLV